MKLATALRAASGNTLVGNTMATVEGLQFGAEVTRKIAGRLPSFTGRVRSDMQAAERASARFSDSMDESARSAGRLSRSLAHVRENIRAYTEWAAVGALVGSAIRELNKDVNTVVESYYGMGRGLEKTRRGMRGLMHEAWNLSRLQGMLEDTAAYMNMPMEAAEQLFQKLSKSVRTFYGPGGKIRYDLAGDAARQILAFSRITGASVDQSVDLYARLTNQFGRSHRQAVSGLNTIARAGQLVNEELQNMGKDGGVFLEDLVGVINDAASAFQGFTLDVENLAGRTAYAVKVGQELGMTYNQAADTAKQMTAIFAKPGGYLGFQGGERLRQEVVAITRGLDDAEERARALSSHFGINVAQGRTLDIAAKGPNAQMNVMEVLAGTKAGQEQQFQLMRQMAKQNQLSLDVFKQFVGGENLSAEQAGDLMQVMLAQGNYKDFERRLALSKKESAADSVIRQSVLVPQMVYEWIKAESASTKMTLASVLAGIKAGFLAVSVAVLLPAIIGILRAVSNIPKTARRLDQFMTQNAGWYRKSKGLASQAKDGVAKGWSYVMSGDMFKDIRTGYVSVRDKISELVNLFREGRAYVRMADAAGPVLRRGRAFAEDKYVAARGAALSGYRRYVQPAGAALSSRYSDVHGRLQSRVSDIQERLRTASPETQARLQGELARAQAGLALASRRVQETAQNSSLVRDSVAFTRNNFRRGQALYGESFNPRAVAGYAKAQSRRALNATRKALRAQADASQAVADAVTKEARTATRLGRQHARRAARRGRGGAIGAGPASAESGFAGGPTTVEAAANAADSLAASNLGGSGVSNALGMFSTLAYAASNLTSMFGSGGEQLSDYDRRRVKAAKPRARMRTADGQKIKRLGVRGWVGGLNNAAAPVSGPLATAARQNVLMNSTLGGDLVRNGPGGFIEGAQGSGSWRRKLARGAWNTAKRGGADFAKRNAVKGLVLASTVGTAYGAWQSFSGAAMGTEDIGQDGERVHAGGRKYDEELDERMQGMQGLSAQMDLAKQLGATDEYNKLSKAFEEQRAKYEEISKDKDLLDALDRKHTDLTTTIDQLKKAKKHASKEMRAVIDVRIKKLKAEASGIEDQVEAKGQSTTDEKDSWLGKVKLWSGFNMLMGGWHMAKHGVSFLAGKFPLVAKGVSWLTGKAGYVMSSITRVLGSKLMQRFPWLRAIAMKAISPAATWIGKMASKLVTMAGPFARLFPGLGELVTFGTTYATTEGSVGKRAFVAAGTTVSSLGGRVALGALGTLAGPVGTGVGQAVGATGGAIAGEKWSNKAWDYLFGGGESSKEPAKVSPEPTGYGMAGTYSDITARGTASPVNSQGGATLTLKLDNARSFVESANARSVQVNTGLSGG